MRRVAERRAEMPTNNNVTNIALFEGLVGRKGDDEFGPNHVLSQNALMKVNRKEKLLKNLKFF